MVSSSSNLADARQTCPRLGFILESDLEKILTNREELYASAGKIFGCGDSFKVGKNKMAAEMAWLSGI